MTETFAGRSAGKGRRSSPSFFPGESVPLTPVPEGPGHLSPESLGEVGVGGRGLVTPALAERRPLPEGGRLK